MSSLTAAFNKSRSNLTTRTAKPQGNVILKVKSFTETTVKGEVMTGPAAGTEIEVRVPNNGGKSVGIKEFTKKGHKSFVDVENGGTLRIEKLAEGDKGIYDARWMRTYNGMPKPEHEALYDAVSNLRLLPGKSKDGHTQIVMSVISPEKETVATSLDALREAIVNGFKETAGVYIFLSEQGKVASIPFGLGGAMVDGTFVPNDPVERANMVIAGFGDDLEAIEKALSENPVSVVPSRQVRVGKDTADSIAEKIEEAKEKGGEVSISTIDPKNFKVLSTGVRVQVALDPTYGDSSLPKDAAERFKERFLEIANDEAKAAFHKSGWRGVSNDDMRRFFDSVGVAIEEFPDAGWSRQSVLLKGGVAIKTFGQDYALPYPNLAACKEASAKFRSEIVEAIRTVVDAPAVKAETPKAEAPATPTAPASNPGIDELDDLLNQVEEAGLGS
jgi:hypothetical protein